MNENKTNELKPIIWFDGRESTRQLPAECIADCSGSGDQTNNVEAWVERLDFDGPVELLKDHYENKLRVLWLWACDCDENPGSYDYLYLGA